MKVKIGIECHVQLTTKSKLFCPCSTDYRNKKPNENTCVICLGFPGSKPKVNKTAIDYGIKMALALNCDISKRMFFSRKQYLYPDMSKNWQISQYEIPLATNGYLEILDKGKGKGKKIRIRRVHLEEDPARLIHIGGDITKAKYVLVDYNRSGIPLCEIVTEPDFESPKEVRIFLNELATILEYLGVFDRNLEGSLRVDANISLEGGERIEVKNISGFKYVERALNFEILRQKKLIESGKVVKRETRHFDPSSGVTMSLRKKEMEAEYGYITETDLPEIVISDQWINQLKKQIPELPHQKQLRFIEKYGLDPRTAKVLVANRELADFFEGVAKEVEPTQAATWVKDRLKKILNYHGLELSETKLKPTHMIQLLNLLKSKQITHRSARRILRELVRNPRSPKEIAIELGLIRIEDKALIKNAIKRVIKTEKKAVLDYKSGKEKAFHFLVGKVMEKLRGRADPGLVRAILKRRLRN